MLVLLFVGAGMRCACGAVSVSLPLEGYYRPGKYMPVRIVTTGEQSPVMLQAAGAVTTRFEPTANADAIVPWLMVSDSPTGLRWRSQSDAAQTVQPSLRPLNEGDRLVACAGADTNTAGVLFPGRNVIPISLDVSRPLLEPAQAWQSLDGVVLSGSAAARLTRKQIQTLLAGGTAIGIASPEKPDPYWPWRQSGQLWVLRPLSATTFGINADAYSPTYDWDRGWPAAFRGQIVFAGALFCILFTAGGLWRSRRVIWALIGLSALAIGLLAGWSARQSPVLEKSVENSVRGNGLVQTERWSFRSPLRASTFGVPVPGAGLIGPVFASGRQLAETSVQLDCGPVGTPERFGVHLERGQSLAFVTRTVGPERSGVDHRPDNVAP